MKTTHSVGQSQIRDSLAYKWTANIIAPITLINQITAQARFNLSQYETSCNAIVCAVLLSSQNLPSNDHSLSHLTQRLLLHYLRKSRPSKVHVEMNKNVHKLHLSRSVDPNSRSVTKFDYLAAVCPPDDAQECLWIQEATGACVGLKQNIINTILSINGESVSVPVLA